MLVLNPRDSHEKHFVDTLKGGQYLNDQELAKTLVEQATPTIKEMESRFGCFFDRNPDGTIHQKAFAGQSFDRTVHKGDLTGIEIISRLTEQVAKRRIPVLEECPAVDLLLDESGQIVTGALLSTCSAVNSSWWKRPRRWWRQAEGRRSTRFTLPARRSPPMAWACFIARCAVERHGDGAVPSHRSDRAGQRGGRSTA